jgi:hypothetical protein
MPGSFGSNVYYRYFVRRLIELKHCTVGEYYNQDRWYANPPVCTISEDDDQCLYDVRQASFSTNVWLVKYKNSAAMHD